VACGSRLAKLLFQVFAFDLSVAVKLIEPRLS